MNLPLLFALVPSENALREREAAIESWIGEYGDDVLRIAYMYLRDRQRAEDAFQEVFLRAFRKYGTFRGDSRAKTWLVRITINVCKDMLRQSWLKRVVSGLFAEPERPGTGDRPDELVVLRDRNRLLWEEVLRLPHEFKDIVLLYYYEELETKDISRVLGVPEGTVRSRLHRAREMLRSTLEGRV